MCKTKTIVFNFERSKIDRTTYIIKMSGDVMYDASFKVDILDEVEGSIWIFV